MTRSPGPPQHAARPIAAGPQRCAQLGATLVDLLVALLLVSLALLGMTGLATATLSHSKTAQLRLTATALTQDYADRARMNLFGVDLGAYDIAYTDAIAEPATNPPPLSIDEALDDVAARAVAALDRQDFMHAVARRLPQGRAVVSSQRSGERTLEIWLTWQDPQASLAEVHLMQDVRERHCPDGLAPAVFDHVRCLHLSVQP